jgi:hypothetical protein
VENFDTGKKRDIAHLMSIPFFELALVLKGTESKIVRGCSATNFLTNGLRKTVTYFEDLFRRT